MKLTDEEKRILDGEQGYLASKCMKFLVAYGEAADAECLVDIDGTVDLHGSRNPCWTDDFRITDDEIFEAARRGEKFKVPTFANKPTPGFIVDGYEQCCTWPDNDPDYHKKRMDYMKPLIQMGMVPTLSCNYYLTSTYWPTAGTHCSWGESSAIPWCNANLGARTNFDGGFQMAYLGKVPCYDLHLDEKRKATVLCTYVGEKPLASDMDYDLFGWAAGEKLGNKVPAFINVGKPTLSQFVKMNSSLNTGGQVRMYHIPGVTPEAATLKDAFHGEKPQEEIEITRDDLEKTYHMLNYATDKHVDMVFLGCPHYNIVEIQKVARLLEGRRCMAELWIMTSPGVYDMAVKMGLRDTIEKTGAKLMCGTCMDELRGQLPPYTVFAMDASKQNYYSTGHLYPRKTQCWYGTMEDCIDAALTGYWHGEWR